MSGWIHKCRNGLRIDVLHGDFSGDVWILSDDGEKLAAIPAADIFAVVADHVRHERFAMAERAVDDMTKCELLGIRPRKDFETDEEN